MNMKMFSVGESVGVGVGVDYDEDGGKEDEYEDVQFVWPAPNFHTLVGASCR